MHFRDVYKKTNVLLDIAQHPVELKQELHEFKNIGSKYNFIHTLKKI